MPRAPTRGEGKQKSGVRVGGAPPVVGLKTQTPHWASIMARDRGTGALQVLKAPGALGYSRSLRPSRLQQTGQIEWQEAWVNYTHVAQRPVAHQSAAVEARASDRTNVLTGLPNNYAERYRWAAEHVWGASDNGLAPWAERPASGAR